MEESANVSMRMKGIFTISRCVSMFFLFYVAVTHAEFIICCFLFVFDGALKIQNLQRKTAERLKFGFAPYSGIYCCENRGSCVTYLQLTNSSSSCLKSVLKRNMNICRSIYIQSLNHILCVRFWH